MCCVAGSRTPPPRERERNRHLRYCFLPFLLDARRSPVFGVPQELHYTSYCLFLILSLRLLLRPVLSCLSLCLCRRRSLQDSCTLQLADGRTVSIQRVVGTYTIDLRWDFCGRRVLHRLPDCHRKLSGFYDGNFNR